MPSPFGADPAREKKIGHRRVDASGETTYKKVKKKNLLCILFKVLSAPSIPCIVLVSVCCLQTTSSALKGSIQLGIGYTVGNLSSKPERDVLMQDFYVVESIFFPRYASKSRRVRTSVKYLLLVFFCALHLSKLLVAAKAATSLPPTTIQTSGLKRMPPWPFATSESFLGSDQMTTW